jgi:hypothetical protein
VVSADAAHIVRASVSAPSGAGRLGSQADAFAIPMTVMENRKSD